MGLSVTPKAHVLEVHSVSQLLRLAEFGGLFDFLEDFVELSHQEGARLARQYASMPSFEQRSKAMHRAEQVKTDPLVQKRQSEMEAIQVSKKRKSTVERQATLKQERDIKRQATL